MCLNSLQQVPDFGRRVICSVGGSSSQQLAFVQDLALAAQAPVESFGSEKDFKAWVALETAGERKSWVIVLPSSLEEQLALSLLSWIKRHPEFHFASVVILEHSLSEIEKQEYIRAGAWAVLSDAHPEALRKIVERLREHELDLAELSHLEQLFAMELLERITETREALERPGDRNAARIYRSFHAIKGSAQTLQYPGLARLVHHAESAINAMRASGDFEGGKGRELLTAVLEFLERQHRHIEKRELLAPDPETLLQGLIGYAATAKLPVGRSGDPQMMLEDLQTEVTEALSIVDSVQSIPLARMKAFLERTVAETSVRLGKSAEFAMNVDSGLSIHPHAFSALRRICMHLARNAVDHGLEDPNARLERGKQERGQIVLAVDQLQSGALVITFEDDGAGVDIEALRRFYRSAGGAAAAAAEKLPEKQLLQLIFSESFSSRASVSEISGRGIGLADVKQQMIELGGMIDVSSDTGKGARFTIVLPRRRNQ